MDEVIMKIGENLYRFIDIVNGTKCRSHCVLVETVFCNEKGSLDSSVGLCSRLRCAMKKEKGCWEELNG